MAKDVAGFWIGVMLSEENIVFMSARLVGRRLEVVDYYPSQYL